MRGSARALVAAVAEAMEGEPAPPAPEIIALNRMGFGPRPGDLAARMALGPNSAARPNAYIDQQWNHQPHLPARRAALETIARRKAVRGLHR